MTPTPTPYPDIEVTPASLSVSIPYGTQSDRDLTIKNVGTGTLTYRIAARDTDQDPGEATGAPANLRDGAGASGPRSHAAAISLPAASRDLSKPHATGELLVKFKPKATLSARQGAMSRVSGEVVQEYSLVPRLCRVKIGGSLGMEEAITALQASGAVEYAEPNYTVYAIGGVVPNDPRFGELWGMHNTGQNGGTPDADIDGPEAWIVHTGGHNVVVGVIDTGVDYTHEDLAANIWTNEDEIPGNGIDDDHNGLIDDIHGWDYYNNDNDPMDDHSHGTHCAGTIGAVGDNGVGVAGVNWRTRIMALKFLGANGSGVTSNAVLCVQYAVQNGAKVLSNSWGGGGYSQALYDAIEAAKQAGALFVAAAGNDYGNNNDVNPHYPSSLANENIIAVASTTGTDALSNFSNYGPTSVDVGAPGSSILSTIPSNGYGTKSGTSMATPHVAGLATLLMSYSPATTWQQVKQAILDGADRIPALAGKCVSGGRINALTSLGMVPHCDWVAVTPSAGIVDPLSQDVVQVRFDAAGKADGVYTAELVISSNDPDEVAVNVPLQMEVYGAPTPTPTPTMTATPTITSTPTVTPTPTATPTPTWAGIAFTSFETPQPSDPIGYATSGSVPDDAGDRWGRWVTNPRTGSYSFAAQDCTNGGTCTFNPISVAGHTNIGVHVWLKTSGVFEGGDYARAYVIVDGVAKPYFFNVMEGSLNTLTIYHEYTYAVPVGARSIVIVYQVRDSANDEYIYIDDVWVSSDPPATATPTATPTPWLFPKKVNFQPDGAAVPCEYAPDVGGPYKEERTYGWM